MKKRKLGYWETMNALVHDHTEGHGNITCAVKLNLDLNIELVRVALLQLFKHHPLLRATIQNPTAVPEEGGDESYYWLQFDSAAFAAIPISEQSLDTEQNWLRVYQQELLQRYPFAEYLWRARILHLAAGKSYLVLSATHAAFDALSVTQLLKEFLDLYSKLVREDVPELRSLQPQPAIESLLDRSKFAEASADYLAKSEASADAGAKDTPWRFMENVDIANRVTGCVARKISLARLKAACRSHDDITINDALNAALLLTMCQKQQAPSVPLRTQLCTPISLRSFCRERTLPIENLGCNVTMVATNHAVKDGSEFWEIAREYHQQLRANIVQAGSYPDSYQMQELTYHKACVAPREVFFMSFGVTNLGSLEKLVSLPPESAALIEDFHIAASRQAGDFAGLLCVATIGDNIYVDFSYTEPLLTKDWMEDFANCFMRTLEAALQAAPQQSCDV